jgi:alpha-tubulin suppressor-like RCC1 family protein
MDFLLGRWAAGTQRRVGVVVMAALVLAIAVLAIASPAQARSRSLARAGAGLALSAAQAHAPNTALAWGANYAGQLGDGTSTGPEKCGPPGMQLACSTAPVAASGLSGVVAVAGGPVTSFSNRGLALLEGGRVMAWGGGNLGDGSGAGSDVPVGVCSVGATSACPSGPFLEGVTAVSTGEGHALALLSSGNVVAWGDDGFGQLGNGTTAESQAPVPVCAVGASSPCSEESQQLKEVIAVAAGKDHSLALRKDGTVVAWGRNTSGQLGNGTTTGSGVPVEVSGLTEVVAIAAGAKHSLALLKGGTVKAWGEGTSGQLGNGSETNSDVPVAVSGLSGATAIAAGAKHSLALLTGGGYVKAWGSNGSGQLGDGSSSGPEACGLEGPCSKTPVEVCAGTHPGPACGSLNGVSAIAAGGSHSLALLNGGTVEDWGANEIGQLGDGTSEGPEPCGGGPGACSTIPVAVSGLVDAKGIAGGGRFGLAFGPPPTVSAIHLLGKKHSHAHGPSSGGTKVTITGLDFLGVSAVKFGSNNAASFTVNSPTSITALSPAGRARRTVDVTVTNIWGTSATSEGDHFRYRR